MRALRHLCLVVLLAGTGCTVTLPGTPEPRSTLQPITRPEMLRSLLRIAVTLESRAAGSGGPVTRDPCQELSELLERNLWNPGGEALNGDDIPFLLGAKDKCVKYPGGAAYLIIDTLSDSRPPGNFSYPHVPRRQVLAGLAAIATTLEGAKGGGAGKEPHLKACVDLGQLVDQARRDPEGRTLTTDDLLGLRLAHDHCFLEPLRAARDLKGLLAMTRPPTAP